MKPAPEKSEAKNNVIDAAAQPNITSNFVHHARKQSGLSL
jgi:hypothetical protein